MTATCPACGREQPDGLLCHSCTSTLERELGDVPAIVAELDITLSKQARIGQGGKGGLASEKNPIHTGAMNVAADLGNTLTTWARDVAEMPLDCTCGHEDLPAHFHMTPCPIKVAHLARITLDRPIVTNPSMAGARLLLSAIPTIRRHPAVVELLDEITDAIQQARRVVDRPMDMQFVGPCLAEFESVTCTEDIYARHGASHATCKVCGITHDVAERRAWLLEQARDRLFTVREAAQMVGHVGGITVTESRIRGYIFRASNALNYRPGTKLIRLGDLLAVVLDESERRTA